MIRFKIFNDVVIKQDKIEMEIKGIIMRGTDLRGRLGRRSTRKEYFKLIRQIYNPDYGII
jgi:hypothetical protein